MQYKIWGNVSKFPKKKKDSFFFFLTCEKLKFNKHQQQEQIWCSKKEKNNMGDIGDRKVHD